MEESLGQRVCVTPVALDNATLFSRRLKVTIIPNCPTKSMCRGRGWGLAGTDQGGARRYLIVSVLVLGLGGGATVALRYKEGNT